VLRLVWCWLTCSVWLMVAGCATTRVPQAPSAAGRKSAPGAESVTGRPVESDVFRARGNEPFWNLEVAGSTMTLKTPEAAPTSFTVAFAESIPGGRRYEGHAGEHTITALVVDRLCADTMTGMPYPAAVTVQADGRRYVGCGGEPASLLRGPAWEVEAIDGQEVAADPRPTLNFGEDGRLFGHASCNTFSARYTLTGEGLTASQPVTTRLACPPAVMRQEDQFLEVLRGLQRFEILPDGALLLHAGGSRSIRARR
jgi:heat shock protein HslJ